MSLPDTPPGVVHRGSPWAQELITHLQPHAVMHDIPRGERFDLAVNGQGMCYLILEGSVAIFRRNNNMLLSTANSPGVFGLANMTDIFFDDYFKTIKPCKIGILTTAKAAEVIEEKLLWGVVSRHLAYLYSRLYNHILPPGAPTAYESICHQLLALMNEEESFRARVTAERYIRDKTQLSRSGVMRILADLKAGGYVEMEEGKLIKIHRLPAKY